MFNRQVQVSLVKPKPEDEMSIHRPDHNLTFEQKTKIVANAVNVSVIRTTGAVIAFVAADTIRRVIVAKFGN